MVGRWLLLLAVVLCASPVLLSPIEARMPSIKNIFNSFRSNPIIQSATTSKPTAPAVQPATPPAQVPNKPGPQKTSKAQQLYQNSPIAQIVQATQQAHVQDASIGTGKAVKPSGPVSALGGRSPRPAGVKAAPVKRKRRPASGAAKRRPAVAATKRRPGNAANKRPVQKNSPMSIHSFNRDSIKNAQNGMRPDHPFTRDQLSVMGAKLKRPQRTRPGTKGKGKKGNKRRRRPAVNAARRQMNEVMDRLFQDFSKAMESRVEPVNVKLATFAARGKVNKWAFVKAKQTGRKSRAEGEVEVAHDEPKEIEDTTDTTDIPEKEEPEEVPEVAKEEEKKDNLENAQGRQGDEDEEDDEEEAAPETVGEDEDDDEEDHEAVEEHEEEAEHDEADDSKKTVALPVQAPKLKPVAFKTAAKPVNTNEAIEKLAAAVHSHTDFDLGNPNVLPDDEQEFATHIEEFESKDDTRPHDLSETPVAQLKPDGSVEYQISITEDDEDEIIKAEQGLLAQQALEDRAGKPNKNKRRGAGSKVNRKKQQQLRRRIKIQRRRLLKRENDMEYPSSPNAELHGLSKISRAGNVRIKTTKRTRLISVPVKFGPLSLETSDETEPALRNAKVTIPSLHGVLRLSERNGRIVNAKLRSAYLRPRRAVVTLTRSAGFDATQDNKRKQLARVVTHFSNQMARLWNAQDLLPGILTTEFHKAFSQPDVISSVSQQDSVLPEVVDAFKTVEKPAGIMKVEPQAEQLQDAVVQVAASQAAVAQQAASQDGPKVEPAKAPVDPVEAVQAIARVKLANKSPRPHVV